jgi:hypothetical protein
VNAYLFKLDFNENINALFWQDLWAEAGEASLSSKKQAFDNFDFPIQYIFRTSCQVEASQYNPGESLAPKVQASAQELLEKLITDGANQNLFNIEQALEDFRVKTVLFGTRPITAKIGLKENLRSTSVFLYTKWSKMMRARCSETERCDPRHQTHY